MVSIIPGIECTAPERTDTSSGPLGGAEDPAGALLEPAQALLDRLLQPLRPLAAGSASPRRTPSVVTVNPSGTGTPIRVISATLAPLPPSRDFIEALPSDRS